MLKQTIVAIFVSAFAGHVFANISRPSKCVNLNVAGVMKQIHDSNPAHYDKVQKIIDGLASRPRVPLAEWMRTSFQAKNVFFSNIYLTTSPAQRNISFVLDDTRYYGRVLLTPSGGQAFLIRYR